MQFLVPIKNLQSNHCFYSIVKCTYIQIILMELNLKPSPTDKETQTKLIAILSFEKGFQVFENRYKKL